MEHGKGEKLAERRGYWQHNSVLTMYSLAAPLKVNGYTSTGLNTSLKFHLVLGQLAVSAGKDASCRTWQPELIPGVHMVEGGKHLPLYLF